MHEPIRWDPMEFEFDDFDWETISPDLKRVFEENFTLQAMLEAKQIPAGKKH